MSRLKFPMTPVLRSIIEHARAAKQFTAPYGIGEPEPSLHFVKDSGIYLLSGASDRQLRPDGKGSVVAYAQGYEPDAPDSWDRCRDAVGGDDFVEVLPLKFFTSALDNGATAIVLIVTEKDMRLEATFPKRKKLH